MKLLQEIWRLLTPQQRRRVATAQLLSIAMALSTVVGIASIAPFFSVLADPNFMDHSVSLHWVYATLGFPSRRAFEAVLGAAFLILVLAANAINAAGLFTMIRLSWQISTDLKSMLLREYLARPYAFHAQATAATLLNNIIYETNMTTSMLQNVFLLVTNAVTGTFIVSAVLLLNPILGAALVAALAGGYLLIYVSMRGRLLRAGQAQSNFHIEETKAVTESLGAIKEIQVLGRQRFFEDKFARASRAFGNAASHTQLVSQAPKHIMESLAVTALILAALLANSEERGVGGWLGQLTFLGFAAYRLLPALQQAFSAVVGIRTARSGFSLIAPDVRAARSRIAAAAARDPSWKSKPRIEIRVEEATFRYSAAASAAVDGATLRIVAGTSAGFIGPNGCGKTTLIDLVAGLLVADAGHIEIDGTRLNESNRRDWQSCIAYVPQSIYLFDASIAQNIALGVAADEIDPHRLQSAAKLALLDEFVTSLPEGYEHRLGERGMRLSGGQRQRIGLARALYSDASVLILDEATNSLDGLSEQEIIAALLQLRGRYTVLLIAHHLSTLRACDVIFEMERGKIRSHGPYAELIGQSQSFRHLLDIT